NLCSGTALNPPGCRTSVYGCQENCPTGALVRVNPREYFTEIGQIAGPAFGNQRLLAGRNLHQSDPPRRLIHLAGLLLVLLATAGTLTGIRRYGLDAPVSGWLSLRWITGRAGWIGIAAVMLYPVRRQIIKRRAGPLRYWMLAHTYLGLTAAVMLLLHGGVDSGGWLTVALRGTFDLVILTGLFGGGCYLLVPRS